MDKNYKNFNDDELICLLFSEGDRLPREAVNEIISRGDGMAEILAGIIKDKYGWERDGDKWWAPVHATFILGAIGGKNSVLPLISSLRISSDIDCDWVTEQLPSIFGKIGSDAVGALKAVAEDKTNDWFVRAITLDSLAAITVENQELEKEIFDFIASFMKDQYEEMDVRGIAGSILLDFKQKRYQKSLLEFATEQEEYEDADFFDEESVAKSFSSDKKKLYQYTKDWLKFYDPEEIEKRQKRWKEENSLFSKIKGKIFDWKFSWEMRGIEKERKNKLSQIKLKYFGRDREKPRFGDAECMLCGRKNIYLGGAKFDEETGEQKFICEDCAVRQYQKEHNFKTFDAAKAQRRRIFDVAYLFKEMVIDKYIAEKKLRSVDDLNDLESKRLFTLADEAYNNLFSKKQKIILEATRSQEKIEKELRIVVDKLNTEKFC